MKTKDFTIKITEISHSGLKTEWETWDLDHFVDTLNEALNQSCSYKQIFLVDQAEIDSQIESMKDNLEDDDDYTPAQKAAFIDELIATLSEFKDNYVYYNGDHGSYIELGKDFEEVVASYCGNITSIADARSASYKKIYAE